MIEEHLGEMAIEGRMAVVGVHLRHHHKTRVQPFDHCHQILQGLRPVQHRLHYKRGVDDYCLARFRLPEHVLTQVAHVRHNDLFECK